MNHVEQAIVIDSKYFIVQEFLKNEMKNTKKCHYLCGL